MSGNIVITGPSNRIICESLVLKYSSPSLSFTTSSVTTKVEDKDNHRMVDYGTINLNGFRKLYAMDCHNHMTEVSTFDKLNGAYIFIPSCNPFVEHVIGELLKLHNGRSTLVKKDELTVQVIEEIIKGAPELSSSSLTFPFAFLSDTGRDNCTNKTLTCQNCGKDITDIYFTKDKYIHCEHCSVIYDTPRFMRKQTDTLKISCKALQISPGAPSLLPRSSSILAKPPPLTTGEFGRTSIFGGSEPNGLVWHNISGPSVPKNKSPFARDLAHVPSHIPSSSGFGSSFTPNINPLWNMEDELSASSQSRLQREELFAPLMSRATEGQEELSFRKF